MLKLPARRGSASDQSQKKEASLTKLAVRSGSYSLPWLAEARKSLDELFRKYSLEQQPVNTAKSAPKTRAKSKNEKPRGAATRKAGAKIAAKRLGREYSKLRHAKFE